ncbi:MAG: hypothetical protein AB9891_12575 [Anaerolineaceae bacterium]
MTLSEKEITELANRVNILLTTNYEDDARPEREEALHHLNTIIVNCPTNAYYFAKRAMVQYTLHNHRAALEDISTAIKLEPDRDRHYLDRAKYSGLIVWFVDRNYSGNIEEFPREVVVKLVADYRSALQKDPTVSESWMGLIACNLLLNQWDDAISLIGESNPFVTNSIDKVSRVWLLCLALLLAGDTVTADDYKPLSEPGDADGIFIERVMAHAITECRNPNVPEFCRQQIKTVNELLLDRILDLKRASRLCRVCGYTEKEIQILEMHLKENPDDYFAWFNKAEAVETLISSDARRMILGFDPLSPGGKNSISKDEMGDYLNKFMDLYRHDSRNKERLEIYSKVIELCPDFVSAKVKKAEILHDFGRYEETWAVIASMKIQDWMHGSFGPSDTALHTRSNYLEDLCSQYLEVGKDESALQILNADISNATPNEAHLLAGTWFQKARVCSSMGDRQNAILCLSKAFSLNQRDGIGLPPKMTDF